MYSKYTLHGPNICFSIKRDFVQGFKMMLEYMRFALEQRARLNQTCA